jgi:hypothetical protein
MKIVPLAMSWQIDLTEAPIRHWQRFAFGAFLDD